MEHWSHGYSGMKLDKRKIKLSIHLKLNFSLPSGLLGVLQTDENYLGRGYASLVLKYVSKKIAEMGQDVYAGVVEDNTPSHKLFKKHGAKSVCEVRWITTKINWTPLADD